jgi:hypothetical protein
MRPYQIRVRTMRRPGRHHGRKTDGIRQTYYDPAIRAAKAVRVTAEPATEQENKS